MPAAFAVALLLTTLTAISGCVVAGVAAAGAAGAGAVVYVRGELDATVDAEFDRVNEATRSALVDLKFTRFSESKDALHGEYHYRTAADKKVEINLDRATEKTTKIGIRIGLIGDHDLSLIILDRIKARL